MTKFTTNFTYSVLMVDTGLTVMVFAQLFGCFVLVIKWHMENKGGKCGCFVLIKNYLRSIRVPRFWFVVKLSKGTYQTFLATSSTKLVILCLDFCVSALFRIACTKLGLKVPSLTTVVTSTNSYHDWRLIRDLKYTLHRYTFRYLPTYVEPCGTIVMGIFYWP